MIALRRIPFAAFASRLDVHSRTAATAAKEKTKPAKVADSKKAAVTTTAAAAPVSDKSLRKPFLRVPLYKMPSPNNPTNRYQPLKGNNRDFQKNFEESMKSLEKNKSVLTHEQLSDHIELVQRYPSLRGPLNKFVLASADQLSFEIDSTQYLALVRTCFYAASTESDTATMDEALALVQKALTSKSAAPESKVQEAIAFVYECVVGCAWPELARTYVPKIVAALKEEPTVLEQVPKLEYIAAKLEEESKKLLDELEAKSKAEKQDFMWDFVYLPRDGDAVGRNNYKLHTWMFDMKMRDRNALAKEIYPNDLYVLSKLVVPVPKRVKPGYAALPNTTTAEKKEPVQVTIRGIVTFADERDVIMSMPHHHLRTQKDITFRHVGNVSNFKQALSDLVDCLRQKEEPKQEEPKQEKKQKKPKQEEPKQDTLEQEEPKKEKAKPKKPKAEESKQIESKQEELKKEEPKQEKPKQKKPKKEESKKEEPKQEKLEQKNEKQQVKQ